MLMGLKHGKSQILRVIQKHQNCQKEQVVSNSLQHIVICRRYQKVQGSKPPRPGCRQAGRDTFQRPASRIQSVGRPGRPSVHNHPVQKEAADRRQSGATR